MGKSKAIFRNKFPIVSPETGEVLGYPQRERMRFKVLEEGSRALIPDDRPVAAAIAFNHRDSLDVRMHQMLEHAMEDMHIRLQRAGYYDAVDDDEGFDADDPEFDPRYYSEQEFVYDHSVGREVPRALLGKFSKRMEGDPATPPAPPPSSPSPTPSSPPSADPRSSEEGGDDDA